MAIGMRKMDGDMPSMTPVSPVTGSSQHCSSCGTHGCGHHNGSFGKKILYTLLGVLLVYSIVWIGTMMRNNLRSFYYIGQSPIGERTITVTGYGKATGANDIAMTSIGYTNTDMDVSKAQADNKKVMDQVLADLKSMGIAEKDLESNYSIYPQYDYTKGQKLVGYQVTNSVSIKIRELTKISDVLALAGKYGANNVSGINFTIDDPQNIKSLARMKALADAKAKAVSLAQSLGVQLVEVVSYNEYEGSVPGPVMYADAYGGAMAKDLAVAPSVATGSQDQVMNVNITYKVVTPQW